jgi:hypothetical protein
MDGIYAPCSTAIEDASSPTVKTETTTPEDRWRTPPSPSLASRPVPPGLQLVACVFSTPNPARKYNVSHDQEVLAARAACFAQLTKA